MKSITATTVIKFSDYGWRTDSNVFSNGTGGITESEITFTATSALNAGQEITIAGNSVAISGAGSGTIGYSVGASFLVGNLSLASNGDQLIAYQGTFPTPTTFISGIHMNVDVFVNPGDNPTTSAAAWDGVVPVGSANNNHSALPTGLITGTNAIWIGTQGDITSERDNARFTCGPNVSTAALARAALNNPANWQTNNTNPAGFGLPAACNFLGQPSAADSTVSGHRRQGNPVEGAVVRLSGTQNRKTITDCNGNYNFTEVETNGFYTVTPARVNYNFAPANRGFSALGADTEASFNATANGRQNPLDTTEYFVRQQYLDFLGREPEEEGFNGWTDTINNCASGDASCDRVHVSEAFFRSEEFQQRGYFVYRFYSTLGRKPDFAEFTPDLARVSGFLDATRLEAAKTQFANDFVNRPAFASQYGMMTNAQYVDALSQTAGVTLSNRQVLVDSLSAGTLTRAQALRQIAESGEVYAKYYNQAFVVMEDFGYLRRDPDALYLNWISLLDASPADSRHMVEGFVDATEYRNRFKH